MSSAASSGSTRAGYIEVSGTGVFGVPYCYRETVYTQERDTRGVARKEVQPAPPNGGRPAGGPRTKKNR